MEPIAKTGEEIFSELIERDEPPAKYADLTKENIFTDIYEPYSNLLKYNLLDDTTLYSKEGPWKLSNLGKKIRGCVENQIFVDIGGGYFESSKKI